MAPAKAPLAKAASSHTKTPSLSSRSVVPAIPLAMMPKKTNKTSSPATANAASATSLDAALIDRKPSAPAKTSRTRSPTKSRANGVNGTNLASEESGKLHVPEGSGTVPYQDGSQVNGAGKTPSEDATPQPTPQVSTPRDTRALADGSALNNGEAPKPSSSQDRTASTLRQVTSAPPNGRYPTVEAAYSLEHAAVGSSTSTTHTIDPEIPNFRQMHHSRLSNGGDIMFGGFPGSHTPSPVPLPLGSAGFAPPPHPPMNGGVPPVYRGPEHGHSSSIHSGPSVPVRPDSIPGAATLDGYGQVQVPMPQAHGETFSSNAARYAPPTPLSYHGSHNSVDTMNNVEVGAPFVPAPGLPRAAANQSIAPHHPVPPFPPFMLPNMYSDRSLVAEDQLVGSIDYFRAQFGNTEMSDCIVELTYADGRHPPVKLPGHKIIICRSPPLKRQVMMALRHSSAPSVITIPTEDKFMRSDAWWMAVQRLYLHPLLDLPPLSGTAQNGDFAGDHGDRFEFCLGYAAAGHLLKLHDVLLRGVQMASGLLNWNTVEIALAFVLQNTRQRHTDYNPEPDGSHRSFVEVEYGYGPETRILMDAIISFLVAAFPPNFELDTTVSDPTSYARIPQLPSLSTISSPVDNNAPAIARGSNAQHRSKPSRLGNIKFGDLPSTETREVQSSHSQPPPSSSILSRILLNIPFDELRAVLSYGHNGNGSWKSAQSRARAIPSVVAAREARRLRALEFIRSGSFPEARPIQERLSANRRYAIVEPWDVLNWTELPTVNESNEPVSLARNWQPTFSTGVQSGQLPISKVAQSMV